jgi:hypothetical protein
MPDFGIFRGFNDKLFGDKLYAGQLPTQLGIIGSQEVFDIDPDALAFFARVTAAGGTLSATEQSATNKLVLDLKANYLWTPMKAIYPMVGASAAACAQNLKSSSFTGTFTSGWTFASTGAIPTNAYMDTGLNTFTELSKSSAHASFYLRTGMSGPTTGYGVVKSDYTERMDLINLSTTLYSAIGTGGTSQCSTTITPFSSLILGSRTSSTTNKLYTGGVLRDTKTATSTADLPNFNYWLGKVNQVSGFFANNECAFASLGDGLTDTEASNLYTAVQAFQTTLSRQV